MRRSTRQNTIELVDRTVDDALRGGWARAGDGGNDTWNGLLAALAGMSKVKPNPEAGEAALQQVLLQARQLREGEAPARQQRPPQRGWGHVTIAVTACLVVLLLVFGGLTALSRRAQPGSLLYPLKCFSEKVAISAATGWKDTANADLDYASRRLDEVQKIIDKGGGSRDDAFIPGLVDDFNSKVNAAVGLASGQEGEQGDDIRSRAVELNKRLDALKPDHGEAAGQEGSDSSENREGGQDQEPESQPEGYRDEHESRPVADATACDHYEGASYEGTGSAEQGEAIIIDDQHESPQVYRSSTVDSPMKDSGHGGPPNRLRL